MVRRPDSLSGVRRAMSIQLAELNEAGETTQCQNRPVPYTEIRQAPASAALLCGRGTDTPCPLLELCAQYAYTEGVHADGMVYGGYSWKRGKPLANVSETKKRRSKPRP